MPVDWTDDEAVGPVVILLFIQAIAAISVRAEIMTMNSNARSLGMGEAFVAVSSDSSAVFFNPAGLARIEHTTWDIANVRGGISGTDALGDIGKLTKKNSTNSEYVAAINKLYGHHPWAGAGAESLFSSTNFAIGAFDHVDARVQVDNPTFPSLYTGLYQDFGYIGGLGIPASELVDVGASFRYVKRTGAAHTFGAAFLADLDTDRVVGQLTQWGRGFGVDLGTNVRIPFETFDLVAAGVWRNIGQTRFHSDDPDTDVPFDDNDITVGLAARYDLTWSHATLAADYRHLEDAQLQLLRKFNFGLELSFPLLDIRGGFREGYWTYGAGIDLGIFKVNAASYGVELGAYPGQIEDRRYVAELSIRLDLDETFDRRLRRGRLKQRR